MGAFDNLICNICSENFVTTAYQILRRECQNLVTSAHQNLQHECQNACFQAKTEEFKCIDLNIA